MTSLLHPGIPNMDIAARPAVGKQVRNLEKYWKLMPCSAALACAEIDRDPDAGMGPWFRQDGWGEMWARKYDIEKN